MKARAQAPPWESQRHPPWLAGVLLSHAAPLRLLSAGIQSGGILFRENGPQLLEPGESPGGSVARPAQMPVELVPDAFQLTDCHCERVECREPVAGVDPLVQAQLVGRVEVEDRPAVKAPAEPNVQDERRGTGPV